MSFEVCPRCGAHSHSRQTHVAQVSYVKAIDIWMLGCMSFVFSSLVELAIVGVVVNRMSPQARKLQIALQCEQIRNRPVGAHEEKCLVNVATRR